MKLTPFIKQKLKKRNKTYKHLGIRYTVEGKFKIINYINNEEGD
jgi:hypothetical protein